MGIIGRFGGTPSLQVNLPPPLSREGDTGGRLGLKEEIKSKTKDSLLGL
jgi:hypothetical protein